MWWLWDESVNSYKFYYLTRLVQSRRQILERRSSVTAVRCCWVLGLSALVQRIYWANLTKAHAVSHEVL